MTKIKFAAIMMVALIATPAMAQRSDESYTLDQMEADRARSDLNYQRFENYELQQQLERERAQQRDREFQRNFPPAIDLGRCAEHIRFC